MSGVAFHFGRQGGCNPPEEGICLTAELSADTPPRSLEALAHSLQKRLGIVDGELTIHAVSFSFKKYNQNVKENKNK